MTERDVAALRSYMERRGGSVVLLYANPVRGDRLAVATGARWETAVADSAVSFAAPETGDTLRAIQFAWPEPFPAGAEGVARSNNGSATQMPVIWRTSVGVGRLIVNGALDSWVYRDTASSDFESFWRETIAAAARATPAAIEARLDHPVVRPAAKVSLTLRLREPATADLRRARIVHASAAATIDRGGAIDSIALWPSTEVGTLRGVFVAPSAPGTYRITVTSNAGTAEAHLVVRTDAMHADPDEADLLIAWAVAHGGGAVRSTDELITAVRAAVQPATRAGMWYPMRSPWWILPFVAALGAEWWWRRRRGMP
jgi:hypothetical protein